MSLFDYIRRSSSNVQALPSLNIVMDDVVQRIKEIQAQCEEPVEQVTVDFCAERVDILAELEEQIRILAYHKWEEAGRPESDGVEFWTKAEAEIMEWAT